MDAARPTRAAASAAIEVEGLCKSFHVRERAPGMGAALRSLFSTRTREVVAVDALSFTIAPGERVAFLDGIICCESS